MNPIQYYKREFDGIEAVRIITQTSYFHLSRRESEQISSLYVRHYSIVYKISQTIEAQMAS